jgi:flagellar hook-basal body complex protein FliE
MVAITPINLARHVAEAYQPQEVGKTGGVDFASLIGGAASSAVQSMHQAEAVTSSGLLGKTDTQSVVQALSNAELTMQTVVAVRDKVLSAYNDVMHMNV